MKNYHLRNRNVCIVGGVAGGASFAARLRRLDEHASIIMYDKGNFISFANCGLPYHIGEVIPDRADLIIQTPQQFRARFNIDVRIRSEVTAVSPEKKELTVSTDGNETTENYDILMLAPGSIPMRPPIPGIDLPCIYSLRTIPDMDHIKKMAAENRNGHAVVIGGGFIGLETAENLRHIGLEVTLVEMLDQVFAPADREMADLLHRKLRSNGISLITGNGVKTFTGNGDTSLTVTLADNRELSADFVILSIGVRPDTAFLQGSGISLNKQGAIIVDEHMRTAFPDIYAVGDAIEVTDFVSRTKASIPLAGPANRQARIAADNVVGKTTTYKDTQGTSICKLFDLTAAVTGLNEKNARKLGIPYRKSYTHSANHATYYPGACVLSLKLLFSPDDGTVLGAQIIGKDGVDKRIDVLAEAVRHKLTITDLSELELAYAPPFGSAKDPVNMARFVAENILTGDMPVFYCEDIARHDPEKTLLLDVRTAGEHRRGAIPDSINIPVDELRDCLDELDRGKEVLLYCQVGLRGHVATRMLLQHGFTVKNLSGGYRTYETVTM
jgi:NADPH-dependent 2,4-dienoyl-CoA reductase/sulfur reductase-like enzyme/rhodanese-related sulfurtransferase